MVVCCNAGFTTNKTGQREAFWRLTGLEHQNCMNDCHVIRESVFEESFNSVIGFFSH